MAPLFFDEKEDVSLSSNLVRAIENATVLDPPADIIFFAVDVSSFDLDDEKDVRRSDKGDLRPFDNGDVRLLFNKGDSVPRSLSTKFAELKSVTPTENEAGDAETSTAASIQMSTAPSIQMSAEDFVKQDIQDCMGPLCSVIRPSAFGTKTYQHNELTCANCLRVIDESEQPMKMTTGKGSFYFHQMCAGNFNVAYLDKIFTDKDMNGIAQARRENRDPIFKDLYVDSCQRVCPNCHKDIADSEERFKVENGKDEIFFHKECYIIRKKYEKMILKKERENQKAKENENTTEKTKRKKMILKEEARIEKTKEKTKRKNTIVKEGEIEEVNEKTKSKKVILKEEGGIGKGKDNENAKEKTKSKMILKEGEIEKVKEFENAKEKTKRKKAGFFKRLISRRRAEF